MPLKRRVQLMNGVTDKHGKLDKKWKTKASHNRRNTA